MRATRRQVLKGAAATAAAAGLAQYPARGASAAASGPVAPEGTTLDATVVRGPKVNPQGYVRLASGPGEPHVVRTDLGTKAAGGREGRRTAVLSFAHLTDIHVVDAQSPARVEFLDRYNDGPGDPLVFGSAYRPQEFLTPQIADSIVTRVDEVGVGPAVGGPLGFAICTGDNADNCQRNELQWQIAVLNGTPFAPSSGDPARFEGVHDQEPTTYDEHYWHPDGTPAGKTDDNARRLYGFPVVKGLLAAATRRFTPHGLSMPWYTCYGNHDGLVQGNFPQSFQLTNLATGPLKVVSVPAGVSPDDLQRGDPAAGAALLAAPARVVTADPNRKVITRTETVKEHLTSGGTPLGHGYTAKNLADGTAYYTFDPHPQVRGIVLDSVNPNGESSGSLDQAQFAWLKARLQEVTGAGKDKLVVVFSHHTIGSMTNSIPGPDAPGQRVLGPAVRDLLLQFPNVVALVNGHTHVNRVTPYLKAGGGGFWEINTAAHVDYPCQARLIELVDNADGTLSIFGTVIDGAGPLAYGGRLDTSLSLASLARELAANDWQERTDARRGKVEDRNVELLVKAPFALTRAVPAQQPESRPTSTPRQLPATGAGERRAVLAAAALAAAGAARWASGRPVEE
ncbi:MAG: TIGR03767 family metallophosphoesterase [Actinobacteria bacterium]|nr:TIGR03767 family metallophosphoesterase [Actinomycetota bacterium]MCA1721490.1 TIGR03767 family metallophosphoesterase [Actinomycetota bacterium]